MNRQPSLTRRQLLAGAAAVGAGSLALPAFAAYPDKPIRWLVPYAAGGATDVTARTIGEGLARVLGQPVVIDNRPGAAGRIAIQALLSQPADGYTLITADNSILYNNYGLFTDLPYTPDSFDYAAMTGRFPLILTVHKDVASNFAQWREWLKRNPTPSYGSPGVGTPHHMAWAQLSDRIGTPMQHVPYKGDSAVIVDLISGQIPMALLGLASVAQYAKDPRLNLLAVTWPQRLPAIANVPTFDEVGLQNFDATAEQGILCAAGTPKETLQKLNKAVGEVMAMPAVNEKLGVLGMYPVQKSPDEFKAYAASYRAKALALIKKHGITVS
ncbi:MAG: tripartite tricarboxylate transporter substrate binding protein [Variovorax sp.]|nr:tripartite tricarboxylate transporter substrate binding protein [Variovorax sp.]